MAFVKGNLKRLVDKRNHKTNKLVYKTTDAFSVVMAANYFNNTAPDNLELGDIIECAIDTDGTIDYQTVVVSGVSSGVVTVVSNSKVIIPINEWREGSSGAIQNLAAHGGILASDSTPIFNSVNGDTDGTLIKHWAASDSNPIIGYACIPNIDPGFDLELQFLAELVAATPGTVVDTPTMASDIYFAGAGVTMSKIEDVSAAIGTEAQALYTITIAAADVPSGAAVMSIELTPGAHTTDAVYLYGTWLEGMRRNII